MDEWEGIAEKWVIDMESLAADIRASSPPLTSPLYRLAANLEWTCLTYRRQKAKADRKTQTPK